MAATVLASLLLLAAAPSLDTTTGLSTTGLPTTTADRAPAQRELAPAQDASDDEPEIRLSIARLTGIVGPGSVAAGATPPNDVLIRVLVEHRGSEELLDAEVVVETYSRLTARGLLREALDDFEVGRVRTVERRPVRGDAPVQPGDVAAVDVFLPVSRVTQSDATGVYPVQVSLTRGTDVLDRVVTAVVHLEEVPTNPLSTVAVWPVDVAPRGTPSSPNDHLDDDVAPGGRLDHLVAGLEAAQGSRLVPAISAHLLDALRRRAEPDLRDELGDTETTVGRTPAQQHAADLLDRLRALLDALPRSPVAGPYAEVDLGTMVEAGQPLTALGGELAVEGGRRVEGLAGRAPDSDAYLMTAPLSPGALALLPGDHLLLPWSAVSPALPDPGVEYPSPLREFRGESGRLLTASVADPWLEVVLGEPDVEHGTVVAVQRVLAETALLQFEAPGIPDRPLLLLPPRDWNPPGRVARDLAQALANAPWMELAAPAMHAALASDPIETTLRVRNDHVPLSLAQSVTEALEHLAGVRGSLPEGAATIRGRSLADLEDQLHRSLSHWFVDDQDTARTLVTDVEDTIDQAYGQIEIPTDRGVRLLGERQEIPITVNRPTGDPLLVEVELRSGGALAWPAGDTRTVQLAAGQRRTLSFDVLARSRGDFAVDVIVRDVAGTRILAQATIRVSSTFISRRALAIVGGVIVLLLVIGRLRRRPRGENPPDAESDGLQVVASSSNGPEPAEEP